MSWLSASVVGDTCRVGNRLDRDSCVDDTSERLLSSWSSTINEGVNPLKTKSLCLLTCCLCSNLSGVWSSLSSTLEST